MNIKELAEQAGIDEYEFGYMDITKAELDKFAELVAAHEREQCAKIFESIQQDSTSLGGIHFLLHDTAKVIRARGKA